MLEKSIYVYFIIGILGLFEKLVVWLAYNEIIPEELRVFENFGVSFEFCEDIRSYFGENMSYVVSLENLAVVYRTMGDLDQAEVLVNQAERIRGELQ